MLTGIISTLFGQSRGDFFFFFAVFITVQTSTAPALKHMTNFFLFLTSKNKILLMVYLVIQKYDKLVIQTNKYTI
jgi:hypothetical protein